MSAQVLTFAKNDLILVGIYANFGSDTCQIKVGIVQVNTKSAQKMSDVRLFFMLCNHNHKLQCDVTLLVVSAILDFVQYWQLL